jgi:predicted DNA-binding protein (MmcQ/YjbR family)
MKIGNLIVNFKTLDNYILSKKGVTFDYPFDKKTRVYRIEKKMFALTSDSSPLEVNLKCDPIYSLELRSLFEGVRAGYHMNKKHWNTLTLEQSDIPDSLTQELVDHSYELVLKSLPKKVQEHFKLL